MIEFNRWTVYRQDDEGRREHTHIVVAGGLVVSCCGVWHYSHQECCERAESWTLVRSA